MTAVAFVLALAAQARADNLARRAHATASESQDDLKPERAIDGDVASRWSGIPGHNSGVWFELAWDSAVPVGCVLLRQYDRYVHELDLEAFDDASQKWKRLAHFGSPGRRLPAIVLWRGPAAESNAATRTTKLRVANITNGPSFTEVEVYANPLAYAPVVEMASDLRGHFLGVVTDEFGAAPVADAQLTVECTTPRGSIEQKVTSDANGLFRAEMPLGLRGEVVVTVALPGASNSKSSGEQHSTSRSFDAAAFFRSLTPNGVDLARAMQQSGVASNELGLATAVGSWTACADPPEGFWTARTREDDKTIRLDDASRPVWWEMATVPSHFAMQDAAHDSPNAATAGVFGVRLPFQLAPKPGVRRKLRFDSVYSGAEVWLDGRLLAQHEGMTPFEVDVTDALDPKGDHLLALRIREHTRASDELDRMSQYADFPLAGVVRKVSLYEVPCVHVERLEVTTELDGDRHNAVVHARGSVCNESNERVAKGELRFGLESMRRSGVSFDEVKPPPPVSFTLEPWSSVDFDVALEVKQPELWDAEHPNLYTLAVETRVDDRPTQKLEERVGVRKVEVVGPQILVNGRPVKFRGTCHHDQDPVRGRAVTVERELQDLDLIREANLNALRTSHYPPLPELLYGADERGLFVEDEAPFCWVGASDDLRLTPKILEMTAATVARDRNHPCVFLWSLCNESEFGRGFERSHDFVREVDPTRPTSAATSAWLEVATHHNPITLGRIDENEQLDKPLLFDESLCIWQGIWNDAGELRLDPGIRDDAWVTPLLPIWRRLLESRATQGSFIWCFADDLFVVPGRGLEYGRNFTRDHFVEESYAFPGRGIVGDAPWGFVDGWRRRKPEFEHVRRLHSPVWIEEKPVAAERHADGSATLRVPVENRFDFTDLSEVEFEWSVAQADASSPPATGTKWERANVAAPPHSRAELVVECKHAPSRGDLLAIHATRWTLASGAREPARSTYDFLLPVDGEPDAAPPLRLPRLGSNDAAARLAILDESTLAGNAVRVVGRDFEIAFDRGAAQLRRCVVGGRPLLLELPSPHVLVSGAPFDPLPRRDSWHGKSLRVERGEHDDVVVHVEGGYADFDGGLEWTIRPDGRSTLHVHYTYGGADLVARELGVGFSLARDDDLLAWTRRSAWRSMPSDHVGRPRGVAFAFPSQDFPNHAWTGQAGEVLARPWSQDECPLGSIDFRSTKRDVDWVLVGSRPYGPGLVVVDRADEQGAHPRPLHVRAMVDGDRVRLHVNSFSGGSAAGLWEWESNYGRGKPLKRGDAIDLTLELAFGSLASGD
jgi:hypothetical protein